MINEESEEEPVASVQIENAPKIKESIASGRVDALSIVRPQSENARGRGPRAALVASGIGKMSRCARDRWLEDARLEALLGNRKATLTSLKSGVKCYISFVGKVCAATHVHDMFQASFFLQTPAAESVPGTFLRVWILSSHGRPYFDQKIHFPIILVM